MPEFNLGEDYRLTPFRERVGRIRGDDLNDKMIFLINRWNKVVSDCEKEISEGRDTSRYRSDYMDTHADAIKRLSQALVPLKMRNTEVTLSEETLSEETLSEETLSEETLSLWEEIEALVGHLEEKRLAITRPPWPLGSGQDDPTLALAPSRWSFTTSYSYGTRDALSYIVSELEKVLNTV